MNIKEKTEGEIVVLDIEGEITFNTSPALREKLIKLIDKDNKKIVVSLEGVGYIDSSGMATVVEMLQKVKATGGHLVLCQLQEKVDGILQMMHLKDIFDIYNSLDEAVSNI
jgi:anti-sigma B factor antagonist